ncbi:MAG TPA: DUF456 domain-containing protein [Usitatibacter sp.]|nr:DUF456 domain-containing protein [Usitatibacter sp.]
MDPVVYQVIGALIVIAGFVGLVVPVVPGALLVFLGLFVAAWGDGFAHVGATTLTIVGVLALLALAADLVGSHLGARRVGASALALVGAAVGGVVGIFFGIPGIVLGPFVGAVAGELLVHGKLLKAGKVGLGTTLGLLAAVAMKMCLAVVMVALFLFVWWVH